MIDALRSPVTRVPILLVTVAILQISVVAQLRIGTVTPDLMLLFAVIAGTMLGPSRGAIVAFAFGLTIDLLVHTPFGLTALCFTLVAYGLAQIQTGLLRGGMLIPALTTFFASASAITLWALLAAVFGDTHLLSYRLLSVMAVVGTVNAFLAPVARRLMHWAAQADD